MRVLIVHPDLGVGGAERLILDIASAVKANNHQVTILTNHYDPAHCFQDSQEFNIITKFSSMPRHLFGRLHALLAYFKLFLASLWLIYFSGLKFDAVICDQISLPVAVFKWHNYKVLFYCHFPDQLLCVYNKKKQLLKRAYRAPIDWLETATTGMADMILVNSQFTSKIFRSTFTCLGNKELNVLYPSLNTEKFDAFLGQVGPSETTDVDELTDIQKENLAGMAKAMKKKFVFLSINRYERKKDLRLALDAMVELKSMLEFDLWQSCHLVMAGGYDGRVGENVNHYNELKDLAAKLDLNENVSFMRSISDEQKVDLLRRAFCLIYTPTNEHFGIVPIEAMYCERPVIATNTGGPLETVASEITGFLASPAPGEFAKCMLKLIETPGLQLKMGAAARKRVIEKFSFLAFQKSVGQLLETLVLDKQAAETKKSE